MNCSEKMATTTSTAAANAIYFAAALDNDDLFGEAGNDDLFGEDGNDYLFGGSDRDILRGGNGVDQLYGEAGNDDLFGEAGADYLEGGADSDYLDGGYFPTVGTTVARDQLVGANRCRYVRPAPQTVATKPPLRRPSSISIRPSTESLKCGTN